MHLPADMVPSWLEGKHVLVTGATGSLGKTLLGRILAGEWGNPGRVVAFSRDEAKQHEMRVAYLHRRRVNDESVYNRPVTDETIYCNFQRLLQFWIGDIRSYRDVCAVLREADIVFNAAALKQVPNCEYFPSQALLTNCIGADNIVRAIREHDLPVETVVGISTDKACKPINAMGMTKALQERIFIAANIVLPQTRLVCVRYGNVLASRGSVIPLFHQQIRNGGPITITNPAMTRFLLTLNDAVDTMMAAVATATPGDIYVPDAPSVTIENLALALAGDRKLDVRIIGERPGEKLHEILVSREEALHTVRRGRYIVIRSLLPELSGEIEDGQPALRSELSSGNAPISFSETTRLLERNKLLVEQTDLRVGGELLR